MATARKRQVSLIDTPYYHCISRCVRRAFLCGEDKLTGTSYEHRRAWVEDKLLALAQVFAIDVAAYAVMNNHTHLVLFVDEQLAKS
ncbi:MAG: REP element-mobilizing transposase RayT [Alteromonadaceae bacterium]|jgi:REP element-mobilizing transposase RayT